MANRCTGDYVKNIITTAKTVAQVESYITAANLIVTDNLANESFSTAKLKEIEAYIAAHAVAMDDPEIAKEKIGQDTEATYNMGKLGEWLQRSRYGEMAVLMDTSGKLASIGKQAAKMEAIF